MQRMEKPKHKATEFRFRENSLEEQFSDEGFGGGLELDQVRKEVGGGRRIEGEEDILGLLKRGELDGQIAMVVGGGEER